MIKNTQLCVAKVVSPSEFMKEAEKFVKHLYIYIYI